MINKNNSVKFINKANSKLPDDKISCIAVDKSNNKWICLKDNGICKIDKDGNYQTFDTNTIISGKISSAMCDSKGNLWFATRDKGVLLFDGQEWSNFNSDNSGLSTNVVYCVKEDNNGLILIGTGKGLFTYNRSKWTNLSDTNSMLLGVISSIAVDSNNCYWIGTFGEGLKYIDTAKGVINFFIKDKTKLSSNQIYSVVSRNESNGKTNILIATTEGLDCISINPKNKLYDISCNYKHGLSWENQDTGFDTGSITSALPHISGFGELTNGYAIYTFDRNFDPVNPIYSYGKDSTQNNSLKIEGNFKNVMINSFWNTKIPYDSLFPEIDPQAIYPFPDKIPLELQKYLKNEFTVIDQDIKTILDQIVKPESKTDMYKTIKDIVYSNLFLYCNNLPLFSDTPVKTATYYANSGNLSINDIASKKESDILSKVKTAAALLRQAGVPVKIKIIDDSACYLEAWINKYGWATISVTDPALDINSTSRCAFPAEINENKSITSWISNSGNFNGYFSWNPELLSIYKTTDFTIPYPLKNSLVVVKPNEGLLPRSSMIPLNQNLSFFIDKSARTYILKVIDSKNKEIETLYLEPFGEPKSLKSVNFKFTPKDFHDFIVLEIN